MELIDRRAFFESINKRFCEPCKAEGKDYNGAVCRSCWVDDMCGEVDDFPANDVCAQIMWERDTAMRQLEEHGIPFCGVAPDVVEVVRCKDCANFEREFPGYGYCYHWDYEQGMSPNEVEYNDFCSYGERRHDG